MKLICLGGVGKLWVKDRSALVAVLTHWRHAAELKLLCRRQKGRRELQSLLVAITDGQSRDWPQTFFTAPLSAGGEVWRF